MHLPGLITASFYVGDVNLHMRRRGESGIDREVRDMAGEAGDRLAAGHRAAHPPERRLHRVLHPVMPRGTRRRPPPACLRVVGMPVHVAAAEGALTGTHVNNPVFPIRIKATNGMTVRSGSWNGGTIGTSTQVGARPMHFPNAEVVNGTAAEQGEMTLSGTNVGTVILFRSKSTSATSVSGG